MWLISQWVIHSVNAMRSELFLVLLFGTAIINIAKHQSTLHKCNDSSRTLSTGKRAGLAWRQHFKVFLIGHADQGHQTGSAWNSITEERTVCKYSSGSPFREFSSVSGAFRSGNMAVVFKNFHCGTSKERIKQVIYKLVFLITVCCKFLHNYFSHGGLYLTS